MAVDVYLRPMATLRVRVEGHDAELFVGRSAELDVFDDLLVGEVRHRIVHVVGPGGVGKSALLREAARRARTVGYDVVWIDGRDLPPFPGHLDDALGSLPANRPNLVVIDSYEVVGSFDGHLRESLVPDLPDRTLVVFGSRLAPSPRWFDGGWDSISTTVTLAALDDGAAAELARAHGVPDEQVSGLVQRAHGSPLALVVGAEAGAGRSMAELADRLLRDEIDPAHWRVLAVASIARVTTPELLEEVLGDGDPHESFKWLASRSFSEPLAAGVTLHVLFADVIREQIRSQDPVGEAELRRRIADHLHRRAVAGQHGVSTDLQHLVTDTDVTWGYSSDVGKRYRIDTLREGDVEYVGSILEAVDQHDWWALTRPFLERHPEVCGVARDGDGVVGGYFVAVAPQSAPSMADDDPLLGPWLEYARTVLRTTSAVIWRDAVDLTGEFGEVTSLLGFGGLLATGVTNPRYGFLPITPLLPAARRFSEALGAQHVEALDVRVGGQELDCHIVDFGPRGLIGFQRDWIYRETGVMPPPDGPTDDQLDVLKLLRDPAALAYGPRWLGATPSARLERLRGLVVDALVVFGEHHDDQIARSIIEAAYLGSNATHDTIARQLHLSRSAYFRRLHAASERVGEQIAAVLRGDS